MTGIYKIESISKPDRIYIGSAIDINKRWKGHQSNLNNNRHHSIILQNHFNKYGIDDLKFSVLAQCRKEDLFKVEQMYLDACDTYFNISKTAGSISGVKYKYTSIVKMKKMKSRLGKKCTEQQCYNISKSKQILTPEDIQKIKDMWNSGEYKQYEIAKIFNVGRPYISQLVNNVKRNKKYINVSTN
jgi:group I intron endonuclease